MDRNDLEQKINEINKKILTVCETAGSKWPKMKKINEINFKTLTVRRLLDQNDLNREK